MVSKVRAKPHGLRDGAMPAAGVIVRTTIWVLAAIACRSDQPQPLRPPPGPPTGKVTINAPKQLEGLATGELDALGQPLRVGCPTCHALRGPEKLPTRAEELREFHQSFRFSHGQLICAACHVIGDQSKLHTADGSLVGMRDAIALCRQCHGPQARDYDHGAHGGMTGYWDLSAGDRTRNHCVDCHDPHVPAFRATRPVLLPRDR